LLLQGEYAPLNGERWLKFSKKEKGASLDCIRWERFFALTEISQKKKSEAWGGKREDRNGTLA